VSSELLSIVDRWVLALLLDRFRRSGHRQLAGVLVGVKCQHQSETGQSRLALEVGRTLGVGRVVRYDGRGAADESYAATS